MVGSLDNMDVEVAVDDVIRWYQPEFPCRMCVCIYMYTCTHLHTDASEGEERPTEINTAAAEMRPMNLSYSSSQ